MMALIPAPTIVILSPCVLPTSEAAACVEALLALTSVGRLQLQLQCCHYARPTIASRRTLTISGGWYLPLPRMLLVQQMAQLWPPLPAAPSGSTCPQCRLAEGVVNAVVD